MSGFNQFGKREAQTPEAAEHAFKRLRVTPVVLREHSRDDDDDAMELGTPSPKRSLCRENDHQHEQSAGQSTSAPQNAEYQSVNHFLGDLHRQRMERERTHEQSASQPKPMMQSAVQYHPPPNHTRRMKPVRLQTNSKLG